MTTRDLLEAWREATREGDEATWRARAAEAAANEAEATATAAEEIAKLAERAAAAAAEAAEAARVVAGPVSRAEFPDELAPRTAYNPSAIRIFQSVGPKVLTGGGPSIAEPGRALVSSDGGPFLAVGPSFP